MPITIPTPFIQNISALQDLNLKLVLIYYH